MNLVFDKQLAISYKSNSQKIRVMSETWIERNVFCPYCGNSRISKLANNIPVADFKCKCCGEIFELKSKKGRFGKEVADGAYDTMIERITSYSNPDLFLLQYDEFNVTDLIVVPKFFFVPDIIKKRRPLSPTAKRAGWTGCNIIYDKIPFQGKIEIIKDRTEIDKKVVINNYHKAINLKIDNISNRGWLFDVLNCVNKITSYYFSLNDVYEFADDLHKNHINNNNIEAKIRQQLQILRDKGYIEFLGRGKHKKL